MGHALNASSAVTAHDHRLSGCIGNEPEVEVEPEVEAEDQRIWVTDKYGNELSIPATEMDFKFSNVGEARAIYWNYL